MRGVLWFCCGLTTALVLSGWFSRSRKPAAPSPPTASPAPSSKTARSATNPAAAPARPDAAQAARGPGAERPPIGPNAFARHVVIISEDGLRPDALLEAAPPVHTALMRRGAYSLHALTIRKASTLPSHAAMLSGFDVGKHGLHWNSWYPSRGYIQVPTIFDAAWNAGGTSAAFVGKWKLQHITPPGSVDLFARPGYLCKKVVAEATRYFVRNRPQVEFIHFSDPDEEGHSVGWMSNEQFKAIHETDKCLGTLIQAVAEAGLDKDTLFILSADHGGHGRGHSGRREEDRIIPWLAWGPKVKRDHEIKGPVSTMDTAATVLWALGYPSPPGLEGRPVTEAFVGVGLPGGPAAPAPRPSKSSE